MRLTGRRTRQALTLAPVAAVSLLLGACSDGGNAEPTAEESTATETEPTETETPDEPATSAGGAACVEGTWLADNDAQAASTTSGLGMGDLGAEATVTGESETTFAGNQMTTEYRDHVIEVSWGMEGQEFRMVNSWSGSLSGTVEVTDEQIVISAVDASALEMDYETFVNDAPLEIPGLADIPLSGMAAGGTSTYTCDGDELRLTPVVEDVDTSGFVTVLHRVD